MNARFYVPSIGRFASADTIVPQPGAPQSMNRYAYSYNNPVNYVDPSGHRPCGASCPNDVTTWELQFGSAWYGSWDVKQQEANSAKAEALLVTLSETAAGILWEPADWAIGLNDGVQWYDAVGMLPLVPAAFGDNIARGATKFISAGWADEAGQTLGYWVTVGHPSVDWARYQAHVSGVEGMDFMFNGVKFDGVIGSFSANDQIGELILLDAKHFGSDSKSLVSKLDQPWARKAIIDEARRQLNAVRGTGIVIQWHVSDAGAYSILAEFFASQGIPIDVVETLWRP